LLKFAHDRSRFHILAVRNAQTICSEMVPQVENCAGGNIQRFYRDSALLQLNSVQVEGWWLATSPSPAIKSTAGVLEGAGKRTGVGPR
jgi:hypothetical protein